MERVLTLPNLITLLRLMLVPVLAWLLVGGRDGAALAVFLAAAASDGLDGLLARLLDQRSRLGAVLDPIADKLLVLCAVLGLTYDELMPLWLAFVIILRDVVIFGGAVAYLRLTGETEMHPTLLGKAHRGLEFGLLALLMAHAAHVVEAAAWLPALFGVVLASALLSGGQYVLLWARKATRFMRAQQPSRRR